MAYVELDGKGKIAVRSEYRERELIRQVPGARWDRDERVWRVPHSWATCVALRGVFGSDLEVGPELTEWSRREFAERVGPALQLRQATDLEGEDYLFPFQRVGVEFLATAGHALLADEMGLGKTVQAIRAVVRLSGFPLLVICPNSMKRTWATELPRWAPGVEPFVVEGGAATRRKQILAAREAIAEGKPVAVIINWESLRLHTRLAGYGQIRLKDEEKEPKELNEVDWATVIADEAHRGKDPKAKQTRALWGVSASARHRFALTGTPVANSPEDLWALMHFVAPDEWPAKTKFIDRYCLMSWNSFGGMDVVGLKSETRDELFKFLDPRFLRRPKEAVLTQLPPKTYVKRYVQMSSKQEKAYRQIKDQYLALLDEGVLIASHPLQRLTRLLQFASAYAELDAEGHVTLTEPSCKLDALEEIVEELGSKPGVVFAESRQLVELGAVRLDKLGYRSALITGQQSPAERQEAVDRFQGGDLQLILATMGAGGEGLTLTAADTVIFLQRSFSAVKNSQAEDRIHRIGQEAEAVTVIDVITEDSIEARVHEVMLDKEARLEEVARDAEAVRQWLA